MPKEIYVKLWELDTFTDKDKEAFKDPKIYNEFRREIEQDMNVSLALLLFLFASSHVLRVASSTARAPSHTPWKPIGENGSGRIHRIYAAKACEKALDCRSPCVLSNIIINNNGYIRTLLFISVIPDFGVCCRRLTPGPGYLEALCEDNVVFLT